MTHYASAMSCTPEACMLCAEPGGNLLWQGEHGRVVLVAQHDFPGYCRVIAREHVREMTDLPEENRLHLMRIVFGVEQALRRLLPETKINLASLGNQVPHVHWHVIPRFMSDSHFPDAIWAPERRPGVVPILDTFALTAALAEMLACI